MEVVVKMSFHACNTQNEAVKNTTWFTPRELLDNLGNFDLDPCTQSNRPFDTAKVHYCGDICDGLSLPWSGRVWLNPPYGRDIYQWLLKLFEHGDGIALVFSRTETSWAQDILNKADAVNFIAGPISFIPHDLSERKNSAANGSMLLAFGKNNIESLYNIRGKVILL